MRTNRRLCRSVALLICSISLSLAAERPHIVFSRLAPSRSGLFLADADGSNERPLMPSTTLDYNASFSADGKWIVFTSERSGSADYNGPQFLDHAIS